MLLHDTWASLVLVHSFSVIMAIGWRYICVSVYIWGSVYFSDQFWFHFLLVYSKNVCFLTGLLCYDYLSVCVRHGEFSLYLPVALVPQVVAAAVSCCPTAVPCVWQRAEPNQPFSHQQCFHLKNVRRMRIPYTLRQIRKWTEVAHLVHIYTTANQVLAIHVASGQASWGWAGMLCALWQSSGMVRCALYCT